MTPKRAAEALNISRWTAWRMAKDGTFKTARRVGRGRGQWIIEPAEVAMLLRGEKLKRL